MSALAVLPAPAPLPSAAPAAPAAPVEWYTLALHVFPEAAIVSIRKETSGTIYTVRDGVCDCPHYTHRVATGRTAVPCKHQQLAQHFLFHREEPRASLPWPLPPLSTESAPTPAPAAPAVEPAEPAADPFSLAPLRTDRPHPLPSAGRMDPERRERSRRDLALWD